MHSSMRSYGALLVALGSLTTLDAQTSVNIACAADNTLYQSTTGAVSNGAGTGIFVGTNAFGEVRRALLRFDVAAVVPANAKWYRNLVIAESIVEALRKRRKDWDETLVAMGKAGREGLEAYRAQRAASAKERKAKPAPPRRTR